MQRIIQIDKYQVRNTVKRIIEKILAEKDADDKNIGVDIPIGVYDIDSMDIVGITEDIESAFGVRLNIEDIHAELSVSEIADVIVGYINIK